MSEGRPTLITTIVKKSIQSRFTLALMILVLVLGITTVMITPKEEDPQISVPTANVIVQSPGASANEIEKLVTTPLEQILWQIKGVEDVYSTSKDGMSVVTVKFFVNTKEEEALVRLHNQITMNIDRVPSIVNKWFVKPVTINDVPIVNVVLYSKTQPDYMLRRIGQEIFAHLSELPDISKTYIVSGRPLRVRVQLDANRLSGFGLTPLEIQQAIHDADVSVIAGNIDELNQTFVLTSQSFIKNPDELNNLVVGVYESRPVYLRDVATLKFGPTQADNYSFFGFSQHFKPDDGQLYNAVTLAFAKKADINAVDLSEEINKKLQTLAPALIPSDVHYQVTRNYGATAQDKVNNLLISLGLTISTVLVVLMISLGRREALIVALSVPFSFSLALFCDYLMGYSINRVTLFALILSIGLVVDDPITNIENIERHFREENGDKLKAILKAVNEVLPPVIMATLTIIVAFKPMFFITGMMGPYMSPMAATVPLSVFFSTVAALTIVPWLAYRILPLNHNPTPKSTAPNWISRNYHKAVKPFLESRLKRYLLLLSVLALFFASCFLVVIQKVPLQLLPFDNTDELQLVIDMDEGTNLETTNRATLAFAQYLQKSPHVTSFTTYVGEPSPMDFNSMVRLYYFRDNPNQADIRINLTPKASRSMGSHEISLAIRRDLSKIAEHYNATLSIVEKPPGPPVLQTVVAEVFGDPGISYNQLIQGAQHIKHLLAQQNLVVDIDDSTQTDREKIDFIIDKEKAAISEISTEDIANTLKLALGKTTPMTLHKPSERQPLHVEIELPKSMRTNQADLDQIQLKGKNNQMVPLLTLGKFTRIAETQPIHSKNLKRLVYVTANTAGRPPVDVILKMKQALIKAPLPQGVRVQWSGEGVFKLTVSVFRDMGVGYLAAIIGIYILLMIQTNSYLLPLLMITTIPLTILGIMPGFWLLNAIANTPVDGFPTPIFFTAASMIGMIALGGIVIRNSVILIDFIQKRTAEGMPLKEAVLTSGTIRFRPIFLTAITTALSAWPITFDPIFSGLAWTLIFGITASTLFSLVIIPVTYYAWYQKSSK